MNKLKKYLMLGMITLIMGTTSINAHAEPTTESEASAGDADKAEDEDGEFKSFTENGKKVEKYVRKDGTYYTGYTTNLDRRIRAHNEGKTGAKYTRSRRPVKLVYYEEYDNRHDAMAREAMIKKLSRQQKEKLLQGIDPSKQA